MLIDIDDLKYLDKNLNLFSFNKFNIFSFYEKDHGLKNGTPVKDWILEVISKSDIDIDANNLKIYCLCYPRILGYVFNPITVWSIYDREELKILIYEVRNTFGEDHSYVFMLDNEEQKLNHSRKKLFHVSPFINLNAEYNFSTEINEEILNSVTGYFFLYLLALFLIHQKIFLHQILQLQKIPEQIQMPHPQHGMFLMLTAYQVHL